MRLMRWEPFREMDDLLKGFSPMFGRLPTLARPTEGGYEFMPPADVIEREKEYLIKVDLPDVRKEDVKVLFDEVAPRFSDRNGGYTRILKLAKPRLGDAGEADQRA